MFHFDYSQQYLLNKHHTKTSYSDCDVVVKLKSL